MSTRPAAATALPQKSATDLPFKTSPDRARHVSTPPSSDATRFSESRLKLTAIIRAPSRANSKHIARPIPEPAPVINATLLSSFFDIAVPPIVRSVGERDGCDWNPELSPVSEQRSGVSGVQHY